MLTTAAHIGVSEEAFWRMTPGAWRRVVDAHNDRERERVEMERLKQEAEWFRAAWVVATIMNFAGRQLKGSRQVSPQELLTRKQAQPRRIDMAAARERVNRVFNIKERFGREI